MNDRIGLRSRQDVSLIQGLFVRKTGEALLLLKEHLLLHGITLPVTLVNNAGIVIDYDFESNDKSQEPITMQLVHKRFALNKFP